MVGERDIKVVCAWCQSVIRNPMGTYVSHGLCKSCHAKHFTDEQAVEVVEEPDESSSSSVWCSPPAVEAGGELSAIS